VAEGARLESVYTLTGIGGSNPSLSAITLVISQLQVGDTYTDTESGRITDGQPRSQSHQKSPKRCKRGGIAASCYVLMDVSSPTLW
jgi:hypothetical protein